MNQTPNEYRVTAHDENDAIMVFRTLVRDEIVREECPCIDLRFTDMGELGTYYQVVIVNLATGLKDELVLYLDDLIENGVPLKNGTKLTVSKFYPGVKQ